jgi:hypothetical protein
MQGYNFWACNILKCSANTFFRYHPYNFCMENFRKLLLSSIFSLLPHVYSFLYLRSPWKFPLHVCFFLCRTLYSYKYLIVLNGLLFRTSFLWIFHYSLYTSLYPSADLQSFVFDGFGYTPSIISALTAPIYSNSLCYKNRLDKCDSCTNLVHILYFCLHL